MNESRASKPKPSKTVSNHCAGTGWKENTPEDLVQGSKSQRPADSGVSLMQR